MPRQREGGLCPVLLYREGQKESAPHCTLRSQRQYIMPWPERGSHAPRASSYGIPYRIEYSAARNSRMAVSRVAAAACGGFLAGSVTVGGAPRMDAAEAKPCLVTLLELRDRSRAFAAQRNWEQYHSPRNLALAMLELMF